MQRADAGCCLSDIGSINTPKCIIQHQREIMMSKKDRARMSESPPGACVGRSLVEMLEDELDEIVDWLHDPENGYEEGLVENKKGQAMGLATAIAIVYQPYLPNIDSVRGDSVRRYEWRQKRREEAVLVEGEFDAMKTPGSVAPSREEEDLETSD